jgi:hypothetical protein
MERLLRNDLSALVLVAMIVCTAWHQTAIAEIRRFVPQLDVSIDLIKEAWQFRDVANIIRRQFHRDDFMRIGIHSKMQLAPPPPRSDAVLLAFAVNLQTSAVDQ